ncbi:MAG: hypothetical protein L0G95_12735, partial [Planococcus sp. (in: firmicutes)]|nr:hypothetical protein [Planococcus sp. (in: firmicutes)]
GDLVEQGQLLMEMDLAYISEHAPSIITPVVFTSLQEGQQVNIKTSGRVAANTKDLIEITAGTEEV